MSTSPVAKLYYFNPNSYSTEYLVAAYSREEAIAAVKTHICTEVANEHFEDDEPAEMNHPECAQTADQKREERLREKLWCLIQYVTATPWPHSPKRPAPCIEEHPIGHVVQTEIS